MSIVGPSPKASQWSAQITSNMNTGRNGLFPGENGENEDIWGKVGFSENILFYAQKFEFL